MGERGDIFKGFLLAAVGIIIIYESYIYNLLDIILLAGILILFLGIALLVIVFTGKDIQDQDTLYQQTVNSFNRQRNNIEEETRKIVSIDSNHQYNENESIFSNINKQFARKYNPQTIEDNYITPEHDTQVYVNNDFQYPEDTIITPEFSNNYTSNNQDEIEVEENKDVLEINKNYDETPIETIHTETLPNEVYEDTESYEFTSNYERPVRVTRKPRKKTKHNEDEYEAIVPQDRRRTASIITEEDIVNEDILVNKEPVEEISTPKPKETIEENNTVKIKNEDKIIEKEETEPINKEKTLDFEEDDGSYVICEQGILSSKEAFELIVKNAKSDILLEVPNLKDLSIKFLTVISKLNTKLIIQKFSMKETSYVLLLTALMERGVDVKVLNTVNTSNLITDDTHALIISKNPEDNMNYGAVYSDKESVKTISDDFNNSWELAHSIDVELNNIKKGEL